MIHFLFLIAGLIKSSSKVNYSNNRIRVNTVEDGVPGSKSHIVHTRSKSGVRCPKQMPREYVSPKKGAQIHGSGSSNGDALITPKPSVAGNNSSLSSSSSLINSNRQNINCQAVNQHSKSKSNGQMFVKNSSCSSPSSSRSLKRANNENHYSHSGKSFKSSASASHTIRNQPEILDDDMLDDSSLSSNSSHSSNLSMDSSSLDSDNNIRHFASIKSESAAFRNQSHCSLSISGNSPDAAGQHSPMSSPLSPNISSSQKSNGSCSNKSIPPARRREHNEQERARRHNLRNAFLYLRDQLPDLSKKAPRIRILCNAYDVVTNLIKQNRQLQRIKAQEAKKKASLLAAKAKLQQLGIEIE